MRSVPAVRAHEDGGQRLQTTVQPKRSHANSQVASHGARQPCRTVRGILIVGRHDGLVNRSAFGSFWREPRRDGGTPPPQSSVGATLPSSPRRRSHHPTGSPAHGFKGQRAHASHDNLVSQMRPQRPQQLIVSVRRNRTRNTDAAPRRASRRGHHRVDAAQEVSPPSRRRGRPHTSGIQPSTHTSRTTSPPAGSTPPVATSSRSQTTSRRRPAQRRRTFEAWGSSSVTPS